jgi:two-component system sensor histidine kinase PilS (NtrC family)
MSSTSPKNFYIDISKRLQSLMLIRVILISLFLGVSFFAQIGETEPCFGRIKTFHYLLIVSLYALTVLYVIAFKYVKNLVWFAYFQIIGDTFFVTVIIYATGGIDSVFSFLYLLTIIGGSIILYRKGGFITASCGSILYGFLLISHYLDVIHPLGSSIVDVYGYRELRPLYLFIVNVTGFYLVAFLSSFLAEQARKSRIELKAKQIDFDNLEVLNESIINGITSGVIAVDDDCNIVLFNSASEKILGIKADEASGKALSEVLKFFSDYLIASKASPGPLAARYTSFMDQRYKRADGSVVDLRFSSAPLRLLQGETKGHVFVFQDMTETKQTEQDLKKVENLAMVGELAAKVAHEIRNPLASMSGSIQMLRKMEQDDINTKLIDIVIREIHRLNHLVNDFLLFARQEQQVFQKFNLNNLLFEFLELIKNSQRMHASIKFETDFSGDVMLNSDPDRLKQVLWNIFLNACDVMPHGGTLYIRTEILTDPKDSYPAKKKVKIIIQDTGDGFDKENLSQLFAPFFTTKEGGSGLGLAIVKGIIDDLGGDVFASNSPEGGGVVTIILPLML